ncbi:MAG: rRNA maturation RNase YbeY [Verrucomicrobiota bacterium]
MKNAPSLQLVNRQKTHKLRLSYFQNHVPGIFRHLPSEWPQELKHLEIVFTSLDESGKIHGEFFQDSTPTDVMSFSTPPVGQLIISPAVAAEQKKIENLSLHEEILTYIIHGCLHFCGYSDRSERDFHQMRKAQTSIRQRIIGSVVES